MKQFYLLLLGVLLGGSLHAQYSFSDDFEAYTAGQFLGTQSPKWTTWSGMDGKTDDVKVSDKKASSGKNSLYFSSTSSTGGPSDVILPFDDQFTKDLFELKMNIFVDTDKTGYFNFQAEKVVGTTWAMDINFTADKMITITAGGANVLTSTYPQNEWFNFTIKGNVSTNKWSALVNGKEVGTFKLATSKIASIDIYPANAQASYYIDDVSYKTEPYTPPSYEASINGVLLPAKDLTGRSIPVQATIANEGAKELNNVEIFYTIAGKTITKKITDLKLASFKSAIVTFDEPHAVKKGLNEFNFGLKILDGVEDNPDNNSAKGILIGVTPAEDRLVVAEEATGTWCGWCPRGAVNLDRMAARFPDHFIGIAVHNNDPMVVTEYDNGVKGLPGFTGFPGASVGRASVIDPSDIETDFWGRIVEPARAKVKVGASFDETTKTLKLSPEVTYMADVDVPFNLAVVIVEDSVKGTASGYNQANYYANNAAGPMGGYELLPNPVPANKMIYNHVARAILGGFNGTEIPNANHKKGDKEVMSFEIKLPTAVKPKNVHIVPIILNENGFIENGFEASIEEAIAYKLVGVKDQTSVIKEVAIYPMPISYISIVDLNLESAQEVSIQIYDTAGKVVGSKNYGKLQGQQNIELNGSLLNNGTYVAKINVGKELISKPIVIQH